MKTMIAYSSKYGATKQCAEKIAALLPGTKDLVNLDMKGKDDLSGYDTVIVGCSVYMGKPRKVAKQFCEKNLPALLDKKVGLYLCCIQDIDKNVMQQFELAYPKKLIEHAVSMEQLGGVVDFSKLKFFDKIIMNMVAGDLRKKVGGDIVSTVSDDRIGKFTQALL